MMLGTETEIIKINKNKDFALRLSILAGVMITGMLIWLHTLWTLQTQKYTQSHYKIVTQTIRRIYLPAKRGKILDINGRMLADVSPCFSLVIYPAELTVPKYFKTTIKNITSVIEKLSREISFKIPSEQEIQKHLRNTPALPIVLKQSLSTKEIAIWSEKLDKIAGAGIEITPVRKYPCGKLASHVLGYVTRDYNLQPKYIYSYPDFKGVMGVESSADSILKGMPGGKLIRVDVRGYKIEEIEDGYQPPCDGLTIELTIDIEIQQIIEEEISNYTGAVVVLRVNDGSIAGMASNPSFNPNDFIPSIPREKWEAIQNDLSSPLVNRAISCAYPPGSVFKPLVALASFESGKVPSDIKYNCSGIFNIGDRTFKCWAQSGHGYIDIIKAIEQSCNIFFYQLGCDCSYEPIYRLAYAFGFGNLTGIDIPGEVPGSLPKPTRRWTKGDTCNISIGQGALTATPLQVAVYCAAIANGGKILRPYIIKTISEPKVLLDVMCSKKHLELIRTGMYMVINSPYGTGKRAFTEYIQAAGKTGTAEYGPLDNRKNYAWMMAYAPFEKPQYVIVVLIEEAISGGRTAAPVIHNILERIFKNKINQISRITDNAG